MKNERQDCIKEFNKKEIVKKRMNLLKASQ